MGFTRPYEFNRADFKISKNLIKRGLLSGCDLEEMSDSLGFLIGNIYYGGRVLEDLDLMVIMALLKKYLNTEDHLKEFKENSMSFSYSGLKELIDGMAESDNPELYGLSENTVMILRTSQTKRMLEDMNKGQGIMGFEEIKSKEQVVLALIEDIQKSLPQSLENPAFLNKKQENSAIFLCLLQEIETCSKLLSQVNRTCEQIRAIIDGKEQNTQNLQEAFTFLYNNTVPIIWKEEYMFVSMKGLGGWIKTLVKRVAFLKEWMNDLGIQGIWLGGLSNQKRLFTSVLQDYSRGMKIPLGELDFKYKVEEFHYESFEKIGQNNKHLKVFYLIKLYKKLI